MIGNTGQEQEQEEEEEEWKCLESGSHVANVTSVVELMNIARYAYHRPSIHKSTRGAGMWLNSVSRRTR